MPHEQQTAAAALNSPRRQTGAIAGPALAGLVVAYAGHAPAYAVTIAAFAVSVLLCRRPTPAPPARDAETDEGALRRKARRGTGDTPGQPGPQGQPVPGTGGGSGAGGAPVCAGDNPGPPDAPGAGGGPGAGGAPGPPDGPGVREAGAEAPA